MTVESGFESKKARIEMIALIDVVFLLLVFFIYAMLSMSIQKGVDVILPSAEGKQVQDTLVITLDQENHLYLDDQFMSLQRIIDLAARRYLEEERPVLIRGDARADLGIAIELLSGLRKQGIESVSFQVEQ